MAAAGIDLSGRKISGHSGKVTCATRLYQHGFDEQSIKSRTGHKSDAVRVYKKPSIQLQTEISNCLQPPNPLKREYDNTHDAPKPKLAAATCTQSSASSIPDSSETHEICVPDCIKKGCSCKEGQENVF